MARFVNAIYCDDIRHEVGNKQSLIGVYRAKLLVPQFPAVLAKLFVVVHVSTPVEQPIKSLTVKILKGDAVLVETPIPSPALEAGAQEPKEDGGTFCVELHHSFSPLPIEEATRIRIRVNIDGEEYKGPALDIEKVAPPLDAKEAEIRNPAN
jgi:hypothetical protein